MIKPHFSRIYFISLAMFFIIIGFVCVSALSYLENKYKDYISHSLQGILLTVEKATQVYIDGRKNYIKAIARAEDVIENTQILNSASVEGNRSQARLAINNLRNHLKPILQNNAELGFFIINKERISLASMRDQNIGTTNLIENAYPEHLQAAFNGETRITPPFSSDVKLKNQYGVLVNNSITMFILTPIIEPNGDINNVLTIRLNPRVHLSKLTELGRIGETGETYAFDKQGRMITQSRFASVLQRTHLQPLYGTDEIRVANPGVNLLEQQPITSMSSDKLPLTLMAKSAIQGNNGINIEGYADYRGVKVFGAWIWFNELQIGFATEIDTSEALLPYSNTVKAFTFVISITLIICFVMLSIILRMRKKWQLHTLRLNKALERKVKIRTKHLEKTKAELDKALVELKETAATDALTNVANRRHFDAVFEREWKRCIRDKKAIAIILFDVDHFKAYNDNYGHLAGDNCLIELAEYLTNANIARRPGDVVARYGGEEFIVLLSDVTFEYAQQVSNTILQGINALAIPHFHRGDNVSHVTVSIGLSYSDALYRIYPNMLIDQADKALYQAKDAGRNQIAIHQKT